MGMRTVIHSMFVIRGAYTTMNVPTLNMAGGVSFSSCTVDSNNI